MKRKGIEEFGQEGQDPEGHSHFLGREANGPVGRTQQEAGR